MTKWFRIKLLLIGLVLLVCFCTSGYGCVEDGYQTVPVYVDGNLEFMGYTWEGQLYLPLRSFCASLQLGAVVDWDPGAETMVVQLAGRQLTARVGDVYLYIDDRIVYLREAVECRRGNVLAPAEGLCEAFGVALCRGDRVELDMGSMALCGPGNYNAGDLQWLSRIIHAEAGNQSLEGQICVGNVVLNRVADERFPDTVAEVIFSPNQFCPVKSGTIYCNPDEDAIAAAKLCLEGVNLAGESLYFVNPTTGADSWFRKQCIFVMRVGDHDFYC